MKLYYLLYVPALVFFMLPVAYLFYRSAKAKAAARSREKNRRCTAELRQAEKEAKQAERERAAERKREKDAAGSVQKRKPGRPRKNPSVERREIISSEQEQTTPAPVPADNIPDRLPERPAPLPTSCTLEQFAAWIG